MKNLDSLKKDLTGVADIVNAFKSESVQLRVLDFILDTEPEDMDNPNEPPKVNLTGRSRRTKVKIAKKEVDKSKTGKSGKKGRPSVAKVLNQLLESGFFNKKRTIAEIMSHTGSKMGYHYKPNEISTPLIRFIRDGKLDREKNAESQFEYFKK